MASKKTPTPIKCVNCGSSLEIDETKKLSSANIVTLNIHLLN